VPLFDPSELAGVLRAGAALGIPDAADGPAIRRVDGNCVFLANDNKCQIHTALGADAKPTPCRQFPLVALRAEDGLRVQVDPGSYGAWTSWKAGSPLPSSHLVATRTPAPGGRVDEEQRLLSAWSRGSSVDERIRTLIAPPGGGPGSAWEMRVAAHLAGIDLRTWIHRDGTGRKLRRALGPLVDQAPTWAAGPPPALVEPELDPWFAESMRRMIWLRLLPDLPSPAVAGLLLAVGATAVRWVDGGKQVQADVWTAWLRALRFEPVWKTIAQDGPTLAWLAGFAPRP
jgi:hypothetical protein